MKHKVDFIDNYNNLRYENKVKKISEKIDQEKQKQEKVAAEFEAYIFSALYKISYEKIEVNKFFGGGKAEEIYRSLLIDEQISKSLKDGKILGIKELVIEELSKKNKGIK